ncbi:hypothetical protein LTR86_002255 [Recurvomyces mirabilis]|nr:hypothetical protein LTR86_002255 [Recurvomyces mirabilis]
MDGVAFFEKGDFSYHRDDEPSQEREWLPVVPRSRGRFSDMNDPSEYTELNAELRNNEAREFDTGMTGSTQTVFQEETDQPTFIWDGVQSRRHGSSSPPIMPLAGVEEYDPPPRLRSGYMHANSLFALEEGIPTNEMSFMEWYPKGEATLSYLGSNGETATIADINIWMIEARCPLLAMAFEHRRSGQYLHLETLTDSTAVPFVRYLYTGSYALTTEFGDRHDDVPTSVLLHCRLYHLAIMYDITDLKSQAYLNVLRQCEFGCSSPERPIDLCAGIRYAYEHLREEELLVDALVNYCVSQFLGHRLGQDAEFQGLAYDLRPFHQALCRNSMERQFENETAAAIIQMPFRPYTPDGYASKDITSNRHKDVIYHFHAHDDFEVQQKKRKQKEVVPATGVNALLLALRSRKVETTEVSDESASENEDFRMVTKRCKVEPEHTHEDVKSEPATEDEYEIVASTADVEDLSTDDEVVDEKQVPEDQDRQSDAMMETLPVHDRLRRTPTSDGADSDSDWTVL